MNVATIIQQERKRQGLSQGDLGKAVGLSTSSISWIETGRREPNGRQLESIASALNIPWDVLSDSPRNRVADVARAINGNPYLTPRAKRNLSETLYAWARDSVDQGLELRP
jgi:transcriptional regulator with XRE-family HTH domain